MGVVVEVTYGCHNRGRTLLGIGGASYLKMECMRMMQSTTFLIKIPTGLNSNAIFRRWCKMSTDQKQMLTKIVMFHSLTYDDP